MLTISEGQMANVAAAMDEDRWRNAMTKVRSSGRADSLLAQAPEDVLKRFCHELGVFQPEDLLSLFELVSLYGIRFYQLPWANPFFYRIPFDYPHETLLHLTAQAEAQEHE